MRFDLSYSLLIQRCSTSSQYSCRTCTMSGGQGATGAASVSAVSAAAAAGAATTGGELADGGAEGAGSTLDGPARGASTAGLAAEQPAAVTIQSDTATRSMHHASTPPGPRQANSRRLGCPRFGGARGSVRRRGRLGFGRVEHEMRQHALQAPNTDAADTEQVAGSFEAFE